VHYAYVPVQLASGFLTPTDLTPCTALSRHSPSSLIMPQLPWIPNILHAHPAPILPFTNRSSLGWPPSPITSLMLGFHFVCLLFFHPSANSVWHPVDSPSHIFLLLPLLATQISSNCCGLRVSQSGSNLLRRQSLLRHSLSTHSTACTTEIPEKVCLPLYPCPRYDDADK
jgi:hypothetical protein